MGIEFFQTAMGRRFYEGDVPRIADALVRIADAMGKDALDRAEIARLNRLLDRVQQVALDAGQRVIWNEIQQGRMP